MQEGLRGLDRVCEDMDRVWEDMLLSSREVCGLHRRPSKRVGPSRCDALVSSLHEGLLSPHLGTSMREGFCSECRTRVVTHDCVAVAQRSSRVGFRHAGVSRKVRAWLRGCAVWLRRMYVHAAWKAPLLCSGGGSLRARSGGGRLARDRSRVAAPCHLALVANGRANREPGSVGTRLCGALCRAVACMERAANGEMREGNIVYISQSYNLPMWDDSDRLRVAAAYWSA